MGKAGDLILSLSIVAARSAVKSPNISRYQPPTLVAAGMLMTYSMETEFGRHDNHNIKLDMWRLYHPTFQRVP